MFLFRKFILASLLFNLCLFVPTKQTFAKSEKKKNHLMIMGVASLNKWFGFSPTGRYSEWNFRFAQLDLIGSNKKRKPATIGVYIDLIHVQGGWFSDGTITQNSFMTEMGSFHFRVGTPPWFVGVGFLPYRVLYWNGTPMIASVSSIMTPNIQAGARWDVFSADLTFEMLNWSPSAFRISARTDVSHAGFLFELKGVYELEERGEVRPDRGSRTLSPTFSWHREFLNIQASVGFNFFYLDGLRKVKKIPPIHLVLGIRFRYVFQNDMIENKGRKLTVFQESSRAIWLFSIGVRAAWDSRTSFGPINL